MRISWDRPLATPASAAALLVLAVLPVLLAGNPYFIFVLNTMLISALLALGLQLVLGYGGVLQLGYAGFMGLGAYASALLTTRLGLPFPLGFLGAILVAAAGGAVMSPIVRLREIYFAMASFVFGLILELVFNQWSAVTNGPIGFRGIPLPAIGGFVLRRPQDMYYLLLVLTALTYAGIWRILHSPFGTALQAMRESEVACRTSGISITAVKIKLILLSSGIAGAAGSLLAHMNGFISPISFGWTQSVVILMMVVVGGVRSLPGAVLGAGLIRIMLERTSVLGRQSNIVFGIVLILVMTFLPHGLAGLGRRLAQAAGVLPRLRARLQQEPPHA